MLAKKYRLTGSSILEEVKKEGTLYQADSFGILVRKRKEDKPSRFAFIISTKISKIAVARNKAKRRLREAVKQNIDKVVEGYDVVFLTKKMTLERSSKEITSEVEKVFKEAGLIK
jgi:ribonuclease P protein component